MRTGIARYTRGLAHALAASPGHHEWLFLISDHHQPPQALDSVPTITTVFDFSPFSHPDLHQDVVRAAFAGAWASAKANARGFIAVSSTTADRPSSARQHSGTGTPALEHSGT